jgi:glycosyltransferase involved in cell wall biosynthesis
MSLAISFIIPVYNEQESVSRVIAELQGAMDNRGILHQIICVNDASTDGTAAVLQSIANITVVTHRRNRGYGAAIKSGIRNAMHATVVTLDADGQHAVADVLRVIDVYDRKKADMVIGKRAEGPTTSTRKWGKRAIRWVAHWLFGVERIDFNSGLRVYNAPLASRYHGLCSNRFSYSTSLTCCYLAAGYDVVSEPIETELRRSGRSQVEIRDGLRTIWRLLTISMAFQPLKVFKPVLVVQAAGMALVVIHDVWVRNIGDMSVIMAVGFFNTALLALMSEMIASMRRE